jgi:hypothetical protein
MVVWLLLLLVFAFFGAIPNGPSSFFWVLSCVVSSFPPSGRRRCCFCCLQESAVLALALCLLLWREHGAHSLVEDLDQALLSACAALHVLHRANLLCLRCGKGKKSQHLNRKTYKMDQTVEVVLCEQKDDLESKVAPMATTASTKEDHKFVGSAFDSDDCLLLE